MSSPKGPPSMQMNGMTKRSMMPPPAHRSSPPEMPVPMTPHHEEIIRYIYEHWSRVAQEVDHYSHQNGDNRGLPAPPSYYQGSREACQQLKDFQAVDLEQYVPRALQRSTDPHHPHPGP